jgi:protein TonB
MIIPDFDGNGYDWPDMLPRSLLLGLAIAVSFNPALAQDDPAPPYPLPVLHVCSNTNPPPCADKPPVAIKMPSPAWPKKAPKAPGRHVVNLEIIVGTDVLPYNIQIVGSADPLFDDEAIKAVKNWRFKAATSEGKPVSVSVNVKLATTGQ